MANASLPRSGYASVPGGELYYEASGSGPAVVLLHAGIADLRMWQPQISSLAIRYTVVCYDARGFGRSRSKPVAFSNRQDLADLLDHLEIDRAALVGCSRGGVIALDFAIERPERAAALVWVCGGVSGFSPPDEVFDPREIALFEQMEAAEAAGDHKRVADLDVRVWADGPLQPEGRAPEHVRRAVHEMALNNYTAHPYAFDEAFAPQPLDPPAHGRLGSLAIPVLAFVGALDPASTAAAAAALAAGAPQTQVARYEDAAHLPNMEHPARFTRELLAFLDAIERW